MNHATPQPLIFNFTPTVVVPTKAATPHVPLGPQSTEAALALALD